jgi:hypothetical protein
MNEMMRSKAYPKMKEMIKTQKLNIILFIVDLLFSALDRSTLYKVFAPAVSFLLC